jgi:hypothetical protein
MPYSTPTGTGVLAYELNSEGLILEGTIPSGTPPTTASAFTYGAKLTDLSTGLVYINEGTTAAPVWQTNQRTKVVALTAANLIAMYAAPVEIVPAVAGKAIIVDSVDFDITRTSTAFTGGGVVAVQYAATANGAGTATTATIAATVVTGAAGRTITGRIPVVLSDVAAASIIAIGLYISNQTAAFAAGTGTASVIVRYHLV